MGRKVKKSSSSKSIAIEGVVVRHRRAFRDYEILKRYEAGVVLIGSEIKSIREHKVDLIGSYARMRGSEIWLVDTYIAAYENANYVTYDVRRERKLLLHKKEIAEIREALEERRLTLLPLSLSIRRGRAKIELGIAKGLKNYDKRRRIQERDQERQVARALRHSV